MVMRSICAGRAPGTRSGMLVRTCAAARSATTTADVTAIAVQPTRVNSIRRMSCLPKKIVAAAYQPILFVRPYDSLSEGEMDTPFPRRDFLKTAPAALGAMALAGRFPFATDATHAVPAAATIRLEPFDYQHVRLLD